MIFEKCGTGQIEIYVLEYSCKTNQLSASEVGGLTMQKKKYQNKRKILYFGSEEDFYRYCPKVPVEKPFIDEPDAEIMAVRLALADYQKKNPKGYAWITDFYLKCSLSETDYAKKKGISQQAVSQRLNRYLNQLRPLVLTHLNRLNSQKCILKIKYIGT